MRWRVTSSTSISPIVGPTSASCPGPCVAVKVLTKNDSPPNIEVAMPFNIPPLRPCVWISIVRCMYIIAPASATTLWPGLRSNISAVNDGECTLSNSSSGGGCGGPPGAYCRHRLQYHLPYCCTKFNGVPHLGHTVISSPHLTLKWLSPFFDNVGICFMIFKWICGLWISVAVSKLVSKLGFEARLIFATTRMGG